MVFASFVRDGANVKHIREILGDKGKNIQIISKIENHQGLRKYVIRKLYGVRFNTIRQLNFL